MSRHPDRISDLTLGQTKATCQGIQYRSFHIDAESLQILLPAHPAGAEILRRERNIDDFNRAVRHHWMRTLARQNSDAAVIFEKGRQQPIARRLVVCGYCV